MQNLMRVRKLLIIFFVSQDTIKHHRIRLKVKNVTHFMRVVVENEVLKKRGDINPSIASLFYCQNI